MINFLDILEEYYTAEDNLKFEALSKRIEELDARTAKEHGEEFSKLKASFARGETIKMDLNSWEDNYFKERDKISSEREGIYKAVILRYREEKKPEEILEDVRRIAEAYEKEDYLHHLDLVRQALKRLKDLERFNVHTKIEGQDRKGRSYQSYLIQASEENYQNCFGYLYEDNYPEIETLLTGEDLYQAIEIFKARIDSFGYERPTEGVLSNRDQSESSTLPELPKYDFVYPTDFQQNLTKASSTIFNSKNSLEDLRQIAIDVSPNKKGLTTTYSVNVDLSAPGLKGTENITEYDKEVHNVALSIARANTHGCFTAKQLATVLYYGDNPSHSNPSPQQIGAVTKSIEKQALARITIDWTEHIKLNNKGNLPEDVSKYQCKGYMLPVKEHIFTVNGAELSGYQIIDEPPLYTYARSVGQIGQHPVKMLNVPINLDPQKIALRGFLLEEIAHIKNNPKSWNNTISVERLLEVAGEDSQTINRTKKKRLLEAVEKMLTCWKKNGDIKGYKKTKAKTTGSPLQSFTIEA